MINENRLSSIAVEADLVSPDNQGVGALYDYERGGVALSDPTQGLNVRDWVCFLDGSDVKVQTDAEPPILIFTQAGIVSLSFCFDQNMRPCVTYETSAGVYLRWYDSAIPSYVTTAFGTGIRTPRVCLDDKRLTQFALKSDIIFAYIRGDALCYRQQRDRFNTEYILQYGIANSIKLNNIGMNKVLRLQFDLG